MKMKTGLLLSIVMLLAGLQVALADVPVIFCIKQ